MLAQRTVGKNSQRYKKKDKAVVALGYWLVKMEH